MAQDTPTRPEGTEKTEAKGRDNRFHYYSGGEVKEMTDSHPNPLLYIFFGIIIVGAVFWFLWGGALGPNAHSAYRPVGGSQANLNALQAQLNQHAAASGTAYASVNMSQLPVPAGQTVTQAIAAGSQVYQSYCIGCHGPNQDGNGVNAEELNPKPRNLHDAPFMQAMSYQRITTSIHKGVPGTAMPRWENLLTDRQIGDAIAYVFSLTSPPPGAAPEPAAPAEQAGAQSGGAKTFVGGIQNSPKPITPAINGNPAAPTNTAPPSQSGPTPAETRTMMRPTYGAGSEASKPFAPTSPIAGGESVATPFVRHAPRPKPAAPISGSSPTPASTATPNPPNGGGGTGM